MSKIVRLIILVVGLIAILLFSGFTSNELPPRPTPAPTATPVPPVAVVSDLDGEKILLHLENEINEIPPKLWTVVEWNDRRTGEWHVVKGWRGTLDTPTTQTWWVGPEIFGNGPFRWQLYESKDGALLATSESFDLPAREGLAVMVNVMLE